MIPIDSNLGTLKLANLVATKALDTLGIEPVQTRGEILKRDLGLESFDYVYIQKVLGISPNIYIISYDTRYPQRYIPRVKLMNLKSTKFARLKVNNKEEFQFSEIKLTPPFDLDQISPQINTNSFFVLRDLAGEYFSLSHDVQDINESTNKYSVYKI